MDAILQLPMGVVLDGIGLEQETKDILLGSNPNPPAVYQLMLAVELADWEEASALCAKLHLSEDFVADTYFDALRWAREMTTGS